MLRNRPADVGRRRAIDLLRRFGADLSNARIATGLSQRELARRGGVSQGLVSRIERGFAVPSVDVAARLSAAAGGELALAFYPGAGIRLRDSGQLRIARTIGASVHPASRVELEVPVGHGQDRRAADMVIDTGSELDMLEIYRWLTDFQAQYRAAQLKRTALADRLGRTVRLVMVATDTRRNRRLVATHEDLLRSAFPLTSRQVWSRLTLGKALAADGFLWIRERDRLAPGITARLHEQSRAE